ncbi:hypothetical protein PO124_06165 [Bacillus licheniformis]|nr:hypothetical protein [Bacillus licheniformis]
MKEELDGNSLERYMSAYAMYNGEWLVWEDGDCRRLSAFISNGRLLMASLGSERFLSIPISAKRPGKEVIKRSETLERKGA